MEFIRMLTKPVHVALGMVILLTGLAQLLMRKGGSRHRAIGRVYCVAMLFSVLTSFPSIIQDSQVFLAVLGLFSLYLSFTGYRFAVMRETGQPGIMDRTSALIFLACALGMAGFTIRLFTSANLVGGVIMSVFTLIFLSGTWTDVRHLLLKRSAGDLLSGGRWLRLHIGRILGSYIAAVTAFLVNVQPFGSTLLNWLLPTAVGTCLAVYYGRRYAPGRSG